MITILPEKDPQKAKPLLNTCGAEGEKAAVLRMRDNADELGYAVVDVKASCLRILDLHIAGIQDNKSPAPEQRMLADGLIRAAASYAANNGAYDIECQFPGFDNLLTQMGFHKENNIYKADCATFIKYCKSC